MRRAVLPVLVGCALLWPPAASARFGISKTRVTLPDPGEKYFAEAIQRVETGMVYARAAADLMAERERWAGRAAEGERTAPRRGAPATAASAGNGSSEGSPARWSFERGSIGVDAGRGKVLEVNLGEGPGGWSPWRAELGSLRPRPARVTDVKVLVEDGVVRLDRLLVRER